MNGITCAAYNGSVVESAARLLVDTVGQSIPLSQFTSLRSTAETQLNRPRNSLYMLMKHGLNETYDAESEKRRSKQRLETFGRDVQAVTSH